MEAITFSAFVLVLAIAVYFGSRTETKPRLWYVEAVLAMWALVLIGIIVFVGLGSSNKSRMESIPAPAASPR